MLPSVQEDWGVGCAVGVMYSNFIVQQQRGSVISFTTFQEMYQVFAVSNEISEDFLDMERCPP